MPINIDGNYCIQGLAYRKNKSLGSICLSKIEYIGDAAFSYCESLRKATIPSSVEYIGVAAFCSSALEEVIITQLFGVGVPAISKHLTHIFEEGELEKDVVVSKMEITTQHGAIEGKTQTNETSFYSLDAIIAVGYRVSSARATKFRIWATKILTHQGLVPVPLIIAKRLNSIRGTRRFTKPSQTDGKKSYCWALLMMA